MGALGSIYRGYTEFIGVQEGYKGSRFYRGYRGYRGAVGSIGAIGSGDSIGELWGL